MFGLQVFHVILKALWYCILQPKLQWLYLWSKLSNVVLVFPSIFICTFGSLVCLTLYVSPSACTVVFTVGSVATCGTSSLNITSCVMVTPETGGGVAPELLSINQVSKQGGVALGNWKSTKSRSYVENQNVQTTQGSQVLSRDQNHKQET